MYVIKMNEEYYSEWEMFNWIHTTPDINEAITYNKLEDAIAEMEEVKKVGGIERDYKLSVIEWNG